MTSAPADREAEKVHAVVVVRPFDCEDTESANGACLKSARRARDAGDVVAVGRTGLARPGTPGAPDAACRDNFVCGESDA